MEFIRELFEYRFLSNALLAVILAGISCGIIGTYVVARRLVFLSGGITHSSFGGIGIAYYLGYNPIAGALVFSVLSALGIDLLAEKSSVREDSAIGILWSLGMAVGIIFIFLTPGYAPNLMGFLFGNILTVTDATIRANIVLAVVNIAVLAFFYRPILYVSFDKDFARSQKVQTQLINRLMLVLISITIVLMIRLMGVILLVSVLTLPPVIANIFTHKYLTMVLYSIAIGILGGIAGLWISFVTDFPSGAAIITVLAGMFFVSRAVHTLLRRRKIRAGVRAI